MKLRAGAFSLHALLSFLLAAPGCVEATHERTFSLERPSLPRLTQEEARLLLGQHLAEQETGEVILTPLPESGRVLVDSVFLQEDHAFRISTDESGALVDRDALLATEAQLRRERHGHMTRSLHEAVVELGDSESIEVSIGLRLDYEPFQLPEETADGDLQTWISDSRAARVEDFAGQRRALEDWLTANGATDLRPLRNLPLLKATLPKTLLLDDQLHSRADIRLIQSASISSDGELTGYAGHGSMWDSGIYGPGCGNPCVGPVNTAIWELAPGELTGRIANYNTRFYDSSSIYMNAPATCASSSDCGTGFYCHANQCVNEHLTFVAASVGMYGSFTQQSTNFTHAGVYNNEFYVANNASDDGFDWALSQPLVYVNRSQESIGGPTADVERMPDWAARYDLVLTSMAAGNTPTTQTGCSNWNTLCVGAYDYKVWSSNTDNRRWSDSEYLNPENDNPGLERPHILGPGNYLGYDGLTLPDITAAAGTSPMTSVTKGYQSMNSEIAGTSYASPAVLSVVERAHLSEGWLSAMGHPIMRKAVLFAGSLDANADGPVGRGTTGVLPPMEKTGRERRTVTGSETC